MSLQRAFLMEGYGVATPARKITTLDNFYQKNISYGFNFKINGKPASCDERKKMILENEDKIIER